MQVARKQHRKRRFPGESENGCVRHRARYKNHVWSYDFVTDRTEDGRQLRLLVVIDEYTRECLAIEVERSFTAQDVVGVLQYLFAVRGTPEHIRSDNGPEFVSKVICRGLKQADVKTLFIAKGSPWENGYIDSFNGTLRDELLNHQIFLSFEEACRVIDRWRLDYNHHRIHSSLDYQPLPHTRPAVFFRIRLRLRLQNPTALSIPTLLLTLVQGLGDSHPSAFLQISTCGRSVRQ